MSSFLYYTHYSIQTRPTVAFLFSTTFHHYQPWQGGCYCFHLLWVCVCVCHHGKMWICSCLLQWKVPCNNNNYWVLLGWKATCWQASLQEWSFCKMVSSLFFPFFPFLFSFVCTHLNCIAFKGELEIESESRGMKTNCWVSVLERGSYSIIDIYSITQLGKGEWFKFKWLHVSQHYQTWSFDSSHACRCVFVWRWRREREKGVCVGLVYWITCLLHADWVASKRVSCRLIGANCIPAVVKQ